MAEDDKKEMPAIQDLDLDQDPEIQIVDAPSKDTPDPSGDPTEEPQDKKQLPPIDVPNFDDNASFESLIASIGSNESFDFSVEKPTSNATIPLGDVKGNIEISGMLRAIMEEGQKLNIQVFSNDGNTVTAPSDMVFEKEEDGILGFGKKETFFFKEIIEFKSKEGLYYYTITDAASNETYHAGKFYIRK